MFLESIELGNGETVWAVDTVDSREMLASYGIDVDAIEQAEQAKLEQIEQRKIRKMNAEYAGVNVSITHEDAMGLLQVQAAFALGVTETMFEFSNGTIMSLDVNTFQDFAEWFAVERNKLFMSEG